VCDITFEYAYPETKKSPLLTCIHTRAHALTHTDADADVDTNVDTNTDADTDTDTDTDTDKRHRHIVSAMRAKKNDSTSCTHTSHKQQQPKTYCFSVNVIHERWGAGVEYHFQEFNEPYAPSYMVLNDGA